MFFTQNIRKLCVRRFRKQRHCGDIPSILCVKIFEANCAKLSETITNMDETELFAQILAFVICDACN